MDSAALLAQAISIAYAAGLNLPATVAILGLVQRAGWVQTLPGALGVLGNSWIIGLALLFVAVDFVILLVPGIASLWETVLTTVRPLAGVVLAVATVIHLDTTYIVAAALLGGGLAITTHGAKLGVRYAVDTLPEPITNFAVNVGELATISAIGLAMWRHPYITLAAACVVLALLILLVRRVWRTIRAAFRVGAEYIVI